MNLKSLKIFQFGIIICFSFISCTSELVSKEETINASDNLNPKANIESSEKVMIMKETSLLIANVLSQKSVRDEVLSSMKNVSDYGEVVSLGYLLGSDKGLRKNEVDKINSKSKNYETLFHREVMKELRENESKYPIFSQKLNQKRIESLSNRGVSIDDAIAGENLEVYSPYNEINDNNETSFDSYYTSNEKLDDSQSNSGYFVNTIDQSLEFVSYMDNDLIDANPSFIITLIDNCDLVGGTCTTTELLESQAALPPALVDGPALLAYNVNHDNIAENDIITTRIPKIKIRGNDWLEFGATHQKFRVFRGGIDSGVTQGPNGEIIVTAAGFQIGEDFRTKRRNVRKENWINFDREFDVDWTRPESSHQIAIFSLHKWKKEDSAEVGIKYGYKYNVATNKWEGTLEPTGTTSAKIKTGASKFRSNAELPRRQVLSTITGPGSTGQTKEDNGIQYNVKRVGIVDYYFKHWFTDL